MPCSVMANLVQRMASPLTRRWGLGLAVLAVVLTASPLVATVWFQVNRSSTGDYDYTTSNLVLSVTWFLSYLAVILLMVATVSLIGRPVRPAWLMPAALALALCQPIVNLLSYASVITLDLGVALLVALVTGCAVGVLAAGLTGVDRQGSVGVVILIGAGVAVATMAVLFVVPSVVIAVAIAILLGVAIARDAARTPKETPA